MYGISEKMQHPNIFLTSFKKYSSFGTPFLNFYRKKKTLHSTLKSQFIFSLDWYYLSLFTKNMVSSVTADRPSIKSGDHESR